MTNRVDDAFKNNNQATMKQSDKRWVTSLSLSKPRMGLILRAMHWDRLKLSLYIKLFYIYELFSTPSSSLSVYRHCCGIIAIVITGISHWEKEGEREGERKWRKKKKEKWLFQRNRLISVGVASGERRTYHKPKSGSYGGRSLRKSKRKRVTRQCLEIRDGK